MPIEKWYLRVGRATELAGKDQMRYRIGEILPGALTWLTFGAMVGAARYLPIAAVFFILLFDLYWFLRTTYLSFHLRIGYKELRKNMAKDWLKELNQLPVANYQLPVGSWREIRHLVIFPIYLESYDVVRTSFDALRKINYPLEKLLVILSVEERGGWPAKNLAQRLRQEFGGVFGEFLVTVHPANLPAEIPGKGANESWAAAEALERLIQPRGIPYEHVIVSVFDADTAVFPEFFGCLTYNYLTCASPLRSSFQPVPLFINNIWIAPAFARVMGFSSTFWQIMQQARPERLITFSSHSMSLKPLVEIGFWQTNVISEDSRIFYQCFLFYDGDWQVVPLNYPVAMDANFAGTFWGTIKNQYRQQRRWGYGAENIPYLLFGFLKNPKISRVKKWHHGFTVIEGFHSWATNAIIIFVLGWLPLAIGEKSFSTTLISYSLPQITAGIMGLAMLGMVTSAVVSVLLLPPKPPQFGRWKYLLMLFQWLLMPINMIFLSAIPAIDAQTRLMLGKYLGFWTTPKIRK